MNTKKMPEQRDKKRKKIEKKKIVKMWTYVYVSDDEISKFIHKFGYKPQYLNTVTGRE